MKKIYQNPAIKIVKIKTQTQMLAASDLGYGGTTTLTKGNLSRESDGDFWDDEE